MTYTKNAYLKDKKDMTEENIKKFYKVMKNGKIFLTHYALACGYIDSQQTNEGYCNIMRESSCCYINTYYGKNDGYPIEHKTFEKLSDARKHLTTKTCINQKYKYGVHITRLNNTCRNTTQYKEIGVYEEFTNKEEMRYFINNYMVQNQEYDCHYDIEIVKYEITNKNNIVTVFERKKNAYNVTDITRNEFKSF